MDFQAILNVIEKELLHFDPGGSVANYIPELAKIPRDKFGMYLQDITGARYFFGDHDETFSIQSISKVFTLAMAEDILGPQLWERVDVEPSGNPFNSLTQLENEQGIPRNPFINAGALVIADVLVSHFDDPKAAFLEFVRKITGDATINYNEKIAQSEKTHGFRNLALVNFMKSFGNINNNVNKIVDFYYHQCALSMSCKQLTQAFIIFANKGKTLQEEEIISSRSVKRINAIMQTCGFYDEAGEFSFRVGLPGKSGVGGGIVAVHPTKYAVAVWSPLLNEHGNSELGMKALENLTEMSGLSIF